MPFRNIFRGHKKARQSTKRGLQEQSAGNYAESTEEPPDQLLIAKQLRGISLNNGAIYRNDSDSRIIDGHMKTSSAVFHKHGQVDDKSRRHSAAASLSRASTAPLPVNTTVKRRRQQVRKTSASETSLSSREHKLHDRRLKDLLQLENYMTHLRQTCDEDSLCMVPSRLCCAQVIKTLYERHERDYFRSLYGRSLRSTEHPAAQQTLIRSEGRPHSTPEHYLQDKEDQMQSKELSPLVFCKPVVPDDQAVTDFSSKTTQDGLNRSKRKASVHFAVCDDQDSPVVSPFCRQTIGRVPIAGKRHQSTKGSSSLAVLVGSPRYRSSPTSTEDSDECCTGDICHRDNIPNSLDSCVDSHDSLDMSTESPYVETTYSTGFLSQTSEIY